MTSFVAARGARAEPSSGELAAARQAFQDAVQLEGEQKWSDALGKLRQALAVKETPGLRFHLAHCEEQLGQLLEASVDYDRATELLQHGAKAPDVQKLLVPAAADVKRRLPHVSLVVPDGTPSASAVLDGKTYAPSELAQAQALNPGTHELRVSAPGRTPFVRAFSVHEGEQLTIRAELPELAAPAPSSPSVAVVSPTPKAHEAPKDKAVSSSSGSAKPYLLVGEAVITAAGLALGIGYASAASSARNRVDTAQTAIDRGATKDASACSAPNATIAPFCADLHGAIDDHDRDTMLSTVGFVSAGVGAAALLTTALIYPSTHAHGASARVEPVFSLGRIGLRGSF